MSLDSLMNQTVTLLYRGAPTRDVIGGSTPTDARRVATKAYHEPVGESEVLADRGTQIGDWLLVLPPGTPLDGWDRYEDEDGRVFDILGPPERFRARHAEHHVEVHGRLVQ